MKILWIGKNKEMRQKEEHITSKVHANRDKFTNEMLKLEVEARNIHKKHTKQLEKSEQINQNIEDLATKLAFIMGEVTERKKK